MTQNMKKNGKRTSQDKEIPTFYLAKMSLECVKDLWVVTVHVSGPKFLKIIRVKVMFEYYGGIKKFEWFGFSFKPNARQVWWHLVCMR